MLKKLFIPLAALLATLGLVAPAHAVAPVISNPVKVDQGVGSYRYTVNIDQATLVTAGPTKQATTPSTTGGCSIVSHRTGQGKTIIDGVKCLTPGTVSYVTPVAPVCESIFSITAKSGTDVSTYSNQVGSPCAPPPPPSIVATYGDGVASFDNTAATVDQFTVFSASVPNGNTVCDSASDDPAWAGATLHTHFAGIAPNKYTYLTLDGVDYVHVPAGSITYVLWNCS